VCLLMFGRSERILTHDWHGLNRRQADPMQIMNFSICLASIIRASWPRGGIRY
jgi:hypothetical protein